MVIGMSISINAACLELNLLGKPMKSQYFFKLVFSRDQQQPFLVECGPA
jgi:hypothetical protein